MPNKGFRIFPLWWITPEGVCACKAGVECTSAGKHPCISFWQKLACSDAGSIRGWWRQRPLANIGILTGESVGLYVVDVDLKSDGDVSLIELCERHGIVWPDTLTVLTGSGGFHYYFQFPKGLDLRNTNGNTGRGLARGIDTRGNGGFVVAPPSLHISGGRYEWLNDLEPAPLPGLLIKLLTELKAAAPSGTKPRSQVKSGAGIGLVITEGSRNQTLFRRGCGMRGDGLEHAEIEEKLLELNARLCSPPLPESEVLKIARSAASYAPNRVAAGV
jgi:putative DNA primase/helicase